MNNKKTDLAQCVRESLAQYLADLGDATPANLYDMVIDLVERPMLEVVMARAGGNQSQAAQMLGMTRNTLRKKLVAHKMLAP